VTKRIEEELAEMNRLKRLELEFLFFKAGMDETMLQKYRDALTPKNTMSKNIDPDLQYVWAYTISQKQCPKWEYKEEKRYLQHKLSIQYVLA